MSEDILNLIDGAIEDWETGPDAMRWAPAPPPRPRRARGAEPSYTVIDETHTWTADDVQRFIAEALGVEVMTWQTDVLRYYLNGVAGAEPPVA
jgi:hypothetical protein